MHLLQYGSFTGSKLGSSFFCRKQFTEMHWEAAHRDALQCIDPFPAASSQATIRRTKALTFLSENSYLLLPLASPSKNLPPQSFRACIHPCLHHVRERSHSQKGLSLSMSSTPVATSVKTSRAKRRMREIVATWLARPIFSLGLRSWSQYWMEEGSTRLKAHILF